MKTKSSIKYGFSDAINLILDCAKLPNMSTNNFQNIKTNV